MSETMAHSLLCEPLFSLATARGAAVQDCLPGLLARLSRGEEIEFLGLQAHQQHPWHAFLVQLAAQALVGRGAAAPTEEEEWRERLLVLTEGQEEPWCLVVADLAKPAFLQPPVPEGSLAVLKNPHRVPATLDILITTKGHDVKQERLAHATAEHWAFALIDVQTFEGFSGRNNYGIVRMNGGFASRPCVGVAPSLSWSRQFLRDLRLLRGRSNLLANRYGLRSEGGLGLLWLAPWDGVKPIALEECAPFFIEICRRIRLCEESGQVVAKAGMSLAQRIRGAPPQGDLGDLWSPVRKKDQAVLTVSESGFTYRLLAKLLFDDGEFRRSPAAEVEREDGEDLFFLTRVMVRGQGKTGGYRERVVPFPAKVARKLTHKSESERLASTAKKRVGVVADVQKKVLRLALCTLFQDGVDKLDFRDEQARRWVDRHDAEVDRLFFDELWSTLELPPGEAEDQWLRLLLDLAWEILQQAITSTPLPASRRLRAVAHAEGRFRGAKFGLLNELNPSGGVDDGSTSALAS